MIEDDKVNDTNNAHPRIGNKTSREDVKMVNRLSTDLDQNDELINDFCTRLQDWVDWISIDCTSFGIFDFDF